MNCKALLVSTLSLLLVAAYAAAQPADLTAPPYPDRKPADAHAFSPPMTGEGYGVDSYTAIVIAPVEFQPYGPSLGYTSYPGGHIGAQTGDGFRYFHAPVHIPTGARIHGLVGVYYDNSVSGYVKLILRHWTCPGNAACTDTDLVDVTSPIAGTPGYATFEPEISPPLTWINFGEPINNINYANLILFFSEATSDLRIGPVGVFISRQVSPAPAVASFIDVPTNHWAFQHIEALAASQITAGTGGGYFSPDANVTRAQMAVFLAKALGLFWFDYP